MGSSKKKCSYNENYERVKERLDRENKNMRYCYVQGPTGPRGDDGAATIVVGTTETVGSSTEALVTNVGTNKDVILNFRIPKGMDGDVGPTGPKGDMGPRGLPGETGISQVITVDGTETIEPDDDALVHDDFENNVHHLTFYIPRGEQGEQGEQGPQGIRGEPNGVGAYGERFSNSTQRFNVTANVETIIPLEKTGPAAFINYDSSYAIEIKKTGIYQINYFLNIATSVDTNYIVGVKTAGNKVIASDIKTEGKANSISKVSGSVLFGLIADEEVTLVITTDQDTELVFDGTTTAKLSVVKLD